MTESGDLDTGVARGSDEIRGRTLASAAVVRALTLIGSGIPTVLAWALMSKRLDAADFAGVSLALSIPLVSSFVLPAMGARIANSVAVGTDAFHDAIARSVRSCILVGLALVALSIGLSWIGWSRLLGREEPDPFPMNFGVTFVSAAMAVWLVLLIGERILIALGEVTKRIWASSVTGPATLLGVWLVGLVHGQPWAYVLPVPCGMILAAVCSLVMATRLPGISFRSMFSGVWSRPASTFGRSSLTIWLIVVEASLLVPIWLLRPIVSLRGSDADVASLSVALQFATPVFSLVAVLGQTLWPFYARNRMTLHRRDVLRHSAAMAGISSGLAGCYAFGLWGLIRADLVGHGAGTALLTAMAFYIVARGAWEPARIIFSTDRTARRLAGICVASCCIAVLLMWRFTDVGHASYAVLAVTVAFAANTVIASLLLTSRLHRGAVPG